MTPPASSSAQKQGNDVFFNPNFVYSRLGTNKNLNGSPYIRISSPAAMHKLESRFKTPNEDGSPLEEHFSEVDS
jgi:hypothetical protein